MTNAAGAGPALGEVDAQVGKTSMHLLTLFDKSSKPVTREVAARILRRFRREATRRKDGTYTFAFNYFDRGILAKRPMPSHVPLV